MSKLGVVEDTLFVPMLGRIYASEHCPQIIYDKKALELKEKLSPGPVGKRQSKPVYPAGFSGSLCQYGSVYSGVFNAQTGWRDRPAGLRT